MYSFNPYVNFLAWIVAFLVPLVAGGLGVMELTMMYLLVSIFPASVASLLPILNRILNIISEGSCIGIVWFRRRKEKKALRVLGSN